VRRLDDLRTATCRFDPGGAAEQTQTTGQATAGTGQQVKGGWFDGWTSKAHGSQTLLDVLSDHRGRPGTQAHVTGDAGEERAVLAQAQSAQEVFVADEHQAKSRWISQVEAQEQTHFFQAAVTKALGFIQNNEGYDFAQFGQGGFD